MNEEEIKRIQRIYELAASSGKPLVAANFPCVKKAQAVVKEHFNRYNKLMGQKMYTKELNTLDTLIQETKAGSYIVGSFNTRDGLGFSPVPAIHDDAVSARKECKRLASLNTGKIFIFVKLSGAELVPASPSLSI